MRASYGSGMDYRTHVAMALNRILTSRERRLANEARKEGKMMETHEKVSLVCAIVAVVSAVVALSVFVMTLSL